MLKLYDYLPSQNGFKIRLLLQHLGQPYQHVPVAIFQGESRTPEFLQKNPVGAIPVLEPEPGALHRRVQRDPVLPRGGHCVSAAGAAGACARDAVVVLRAVLRRADDRHAALSGRSPASCRRTRQSQRSSAAQASALWMLWSGI